MSRERGAELRLLQVPGPDDAGDVTMSRVSGQSVSGVHRRSLQDQGDSSRGKLKFKSPPFGPFKCALLKQAFYF